MSPGMLVVAAFAGCLVGFFALSLGIAVILQGFLYGQPADKLPLRALVAGLLLALVIVGWGYANARASHKDKYGTFFEFNPTAVRDIDAFEAMRILSVKDQTGKPREETVAYVLQGKAFVEKETLRPFARSSSNYVTTALLIKTDDGPAKKFVAPPLEGMRYSGLTNASDALTFTEENGSAFVTDQDLRKLETPSKGAFLIALLLNAGLFIAFFAAHWPILQYRMGHAALLTVLLGGVTLFILMPLLFNLLQAK